MSGMMMTGRLLGVKHAMMSGIATVVIETCDGKIETVHADAGPLFRALNASGAKRGDAITYETDGLGLMTGFSLED